MDRRDSLKALFLAPLAGGILVSGCAPEAESVAKIASSDGYSYGRTKKEKEYDSKVLSGTFFNDHELASIAVLCDIILPDNGSVGGALEAGVTEFVEFIVKDMPRHQLPIRGGLMWLDAYANKKFNAEFLSLSATRQFSLCDEIAFPDVKDEELQAGIRFFSLMRDLTLTGYYTTELGIKDLGYQGNTPNIWDGVPESILKKHGVSYESEWLAKCVDQSQRDIVAVWDDDMKLIS